MSAMNKSRFMPHKVIFHTCNLVCLLVKMSVPLMSYWCCMLDLHVGNMHRNSQIVYEFDKFMGSHAVQTLRLGRSGARCPTSPQLCPSLPRRQMRSFLLQNSYGRPINMPRNYERKTNMGMVDQGVMLRAVNAVIDGKSSRKVAEEKGILKRYVKQYI